MQCKLVDDVVLDSRCGGRRTRLERHVERLSQIAQLPVLRAKVVPPLTDAMGFVDGHAGDSLRHQPLLKRRLHESLGSNVQQMQVTLLDAVTYATMLAA